MLAPGSGERPLGRRFVDDARVVEHHAIIPTATRADSISLPEDERRIYDLVCRRLLTAWHLDHLYSTTTVVTLVAEADRYRSTGTRVDQLGWRILEPRRTPRSEEPAAGAAAVGAAPAGDSASGAGAARRGDAESRSSRSWRPARAWTSPMRAVSSAPPDRRDATARPLVV